MAVGIPAAATATVCLALTLFALQTKRDFVVTGAFSLTAVVGLYIFASTYLKSSEDAKNNDDDEKNKVILVTKLSELNDYVEKGELENIKKIIEYFFDNLLYNKNILASIYKSRYTCVTQTEVIISACEHKQVGVLEYLLSETDILDHLTDKSFDVQQVEMQKKTAFRYAICSDNFRMVEMLYDYWCGDVHWTEHNISNMKKIGELLNETFLELEVHLNTDLQLLADIRGLVKFNEFQLELYRYLHTLPDSKNNTNEAMLNRLLSVLCIYNKYSNLDFVRRSLSDPERELALKDLLKDNSSIYCRGSSYIMYEVYFRKLDLSICTLILENLSVLRKHLCERFNKTEEEFINSPDIKLSYVSAVSLYEEIECTLYHYIYRTSEDWRLYLPGDRQPTLITDRIGAHKGKIYNLKLKFDSYKVYNGPVLFLERLNFERCVNKLKKLLEDHVIRTKPLFSISWFITVCVASLRTFIASLRCFAAWCARIEPQDSATCNQQTKTSFPEILMDDNYLKQTEYIRDHYSLRKIVYYIEALQNSNDIDILMIERVLQVIGEMLKSTKETKHLSESTKALLHTAISVETIGHLHNIRNYLTHVQKGQMTRRINIASSQNQVFGEIKQDLIELLRIVNPILDIYKYMVDKWLLEKGSQLLDERIEELPAKAKQFKDTIYDRFKRYGTKHEDNFVKKHWKQTGLTRQLLREIPWIQNNRDEVLSKKLLVSTQIRSVSIVMLPMYINNIIETLDRIRENNKKVEMFNNQLDLHNIKRIMAYPDNSNINSQRDIILKEQKKNNQNLDLLLKDLNDLKDLKMQWESVKTVLKFFICEMNCELFNVLDSEFLKNIDVPDDQTLDNVVKLLFVLKILCQHHNNLVPDAKILEKLLKFLSQIKSLCQPLWGSITPLYSDLNKTHSFDAIKKLDSDLFVFLYKRKNKNDRNRKEQLLSCLIDRLDHLKTILEYPKKISLSQYLLKYKRDQKFSFQLEMLLGDIANIFAYCKIHLMNKSTKLLKEIDLGNVLDHGNPFLDVISECLDSRDLPTALLSKAIMVANDRDAIVALHELFKENIEHKTIKDGNKNGMNHKQKKYLDQFKMCDKDRQESYLKLIYIYKKP